MERTRTQCTSLANTFAEKRQPPSSPTTENQTKTKLPVIITARNESSLEFLTLPCKPLQSHSPNRDRVLTLRRTKRPTANGQTKKQISGSHENIVPSRPLFLRLRRGFFHLLLTQQIGSRNANEFLEYDWCHVFSSMWRLTVSKANRLTAAMRAPTPLLMILLRLRSSSESSMQIFCNWSISIAMRCNYINLKMNSVA